MRSNTDDVGGTRRDVELILARMRREHHKHPVSNSVERRGTMCREVQVSETCYVDVTREVFMSLAGDDAIRNGACSSFADSSYTVERVDMPVFMASRGVAEWE